MALSRAQIERYSRQLIVARLGGRAQERLLAARLLLVGAPDDAETPLAYLVGAGVGKIHLRLAGRPHPGVSELAARMRNLNPDAAVEPSLDPGTPVDLIFAILGSEAAVEAAGEVWRAAGPGSAIVVRLDIPERIAILAEPPPCPRCASGEGLFASFGRRSEYAGIVGMAGTVEAFKVLAGYHPKAGPSIIEFDGLKTRCRPVSANTGPARCGCDRAAAPSS